MSIRPKDWGIVLLVGLVAAAIGTPASFADCPDDVWQDCEWCGQDCWTETEHADMTHNCVVDLIDYALMWIYYGNGTSTEPSGDLDGNGWVTPVDIAMFIGCYWGHPEVTPCTPYQDGWFGSLGWFRVGFSGDPEEDLDRIDLPPFQESTAYAIADGCDSLSAVEVCFYSSPNVVITGTLNPGGGQELGDGSWAFVDALDGSPHLIDGITFYVTDDQPAFIGLKDCTQFPQQGLEWARVFDTSMGGFETVSFGGVNGDPPEDSLSTPSGLPDVMPDAGAGFAVMPNPTEGTIAVQFDLSSVESAEVSVYSASGRLVRQLHSGRVVPGGVVRWDGEDATGKRVPPGVYFVRVAREGGRETSERIIVLR